jgi:cytochrome c-type biogenesis protein CcmF
VAALILGFSGEVFKIQVEELQAKEGETFTVAGFSLAFRALAQREEGNKTITEALLDVGSSASGLGEASLAPAQFLFAAQNRQVTTEIDTWVRPMEDLYVALVGYDLRSKVAVFKVVVNPLVIWLWIGTALIVLGSALALLPGQVRGPADPEPPGGGDAC